MCIRDRAKTILSEIKAVTSEKTEKLLTYGLTVIVVGISVINQGLGTTEQELESFKREAGLTDLSSDGLNRKVYAWGLPVSRLPTHSVRLPMVCLWENIVRGMFP